MNPLSMRPSQGAPLLRLWTQLVRSFERETTRNPRIHLGLLAILAILLVGLWFKIDDARRYAQKTIIDGEQQAARLQRLAGETDWKARREGVQRLRVQLESRLWQAESDGLAQADFQDLIGRLAKGANIQHLDSHVEIIGATAASQNYRQMSATVGGPFTAESLQKLLADLDSDEHLLVVDRLRVETVPVPRFEMLLSTYLRPSAAAQARRP